MSNIRLYIQDSSLSQDALICLPKTQSRYLSKVMRLKVGDVISAFNTSGEFIASIIQIQGSSCMIKMQEMTRSPEIEPELTLAYCPTKHVKFSYIAQKCAELGVTKIQPLISARSIVKSFDIERITSIIIEAAEQCNRLSLCTILQSKSLRDFLHSPAITGKILFCDCSFGQNDALPSANITSADNAILIGPEGGFSEEEISMAQKFEYVKGISLGRRVLRADTAVVYSLSVYQSLYEHKNINQNI